MSCWSRCGSSTCTPAPQVRPGRKSLAYKLTFRAPDRTLTGEEAVAARDAAVAAAASGPGPRSVPETLERLRSRWSPARPPGSAGRWSRGWRPAASRWRGWRATRTGWRAAMAEVGEATGVRTLAVAADVTDRPAVEAAVEAVAEELGHVDLLVNNAGSSTRRGPGLGGRPRPVVGRRLQSRQGRLLLCPRRRPGMLPATTAGWSTWPVA